MLRLYEDDGAGSGDSGDLKRLEAAMQSGGRQSRRAVQTYWATRGGGDASSENHPLTYRKNLGWSLLLAEWIEAAGVSRQAPILELGCNIGRNVAFLRSRGFANLSAIEINGHALNVMREVHPGTARNTRLIHAPLEDALPALADGEFELVFSMAVLEHVHADSNFIFEHIRRVARRFVLTIEDEVGDGPRHFRRDYGLVFEGLGLRQVRSFAFADAELELASLLELEPEFIMRLFERV